MPWIVNNAHTYTAKSTKHKAQSTYIHGSLPNRMLPEKRDANEATIQPNDETNFWFIFDWNLHIIKVSGPHETDLMASFQMFASVRQYLNDAFISSHLLLSLITNTNLLLEPLTQRKEEIFACMVKISCCNVSLFVVVGVVWKCSGDGNSWLPIVKILTNQYTRPTEMYWQNETYLIALCASKGARCVCVTACITTQFKKQVRTSFYCTAHSVFPSIRHLWMCVYCVILLLFDLLSINLAGEQNC